jgi:outer membrane lipoprotein SlyB
MKTPLITSALVLSALLLQGCAYRSHAENVYADTETQRAHSITLATVTAVRLVTIERAPTGTGGAAGANVGMALGSFASKGPGSFVGSVLASVAGDLAGQAIESRVARLPGLEISMRLDNGQQISLVQAADEPFKKGDRVRVLSAEGKSRVSR